MSSVPSSQPIRVHRPGRDKRWIPMSCGLLGILLVLAAPCGGQELEPRRWSHIPTGSVFAGIGYAYTEGDIYFDPVVELEDTEFSMHSLAAKALYSFQLLGRSARVELGVPYAEGAWSGTLSGEPASTERHGFMDPKARFAVNLVGAPPLKGQEFAAYRQKTPSEFVLGAGLVLHMPMGQYYAERLINLGDNRWTIRPQLGMEYVYGRWTYELSGAMWFFTDNEEFYPGSQLREQDPVYTLQGHLIHTFRPGFWASLSTGYGLGGETSINGVSKDDAREIWLTSISLGAPLSRRAGVKVAGISTRTQTDLGADSDTAVFAFSYFW